MQNKKTQIYEIKISGLLEERWSSWFENLELTQEEGNTLLTGDILDQSALHGILNRIRDLNFFLISVNRVNL